MKYAPMLRALQDRNKLIYFQVNCRDYNPSDMIQRLQDYVGQILKCERKEKTLGLDHYLAIAFANHMEIDIQSGLWKRFPGICPYCTQRPCGCEVRRESRAQKLDPICAEPSSAHDFQIMLREIYPANTFAGSARHLAEEAFELNKAFRHYRGKHESVMLDDIIEEQIDVVTNLFGVASTQSIDLSESFHIAFEDGCYRCRKTPCGCGFVTEKMPTIC